MLARAAKGRHDGRPERRGRRRDVRRLQPLSARRLAGRARRPLAHPRDLPRPPRRRRRRCSGWRDGLARAEAGRPAAAADHAAAAGDRLRRMAAQRPAGEARPLPDGPQPRGPHALSRSGRSPTSPSACPIGPRCAAAGQMAVARVAVPQLPGRRAFRAQAGVQSAGGDLDRRPRRAPGRPRRDPARHRRVPAGRTVRAVDRRRRRTAARPPGRCSSMRSGTAATCSGFRRRLDRGRAGRRREGGLSRRTPWKTASWKASKSSVAPSGKRTRTFRRCSRTKATASRAAAATNSAGCSAGRSGDPCWTMYVTQLSYRPARGAGKRGALRSTAARGLVSPALMPQSAANAAVVPLADPPARARVSLCVPFHDESETLPLLVQALDAFAASRRRGAGSSSTPSSSTTAARTTARRCCRTWPPPAGWRSTCGCSG